jgi:radical SAM protein with 4Fe4S-binding SPASM domain
VTLYGTSREDYDALCGDPDAFDRVVEALQWLKAEGILVHLNTTIAPENMASWERLEQFGDTLGIGLRMTTYCFPPVRREVCGVCDGFRRITAEEAGDLTVRDILYREGVESIRKRAASMSAPPSSDCRLDTGESISCMAGRAQFWVNWYGGMTPCGMLPEPQVHPMAEGFPAAWDRLRQQTAQIRLCPECSTCKERHTCMNCAAVIYTETGTFTEKPEYMCWLNRAYRQALKQYSGEELSPFFPQ